MSLTLIKSTEIKTMPKKKKLCWNIFFVIFVNIFVIKLMNLIMVRL